MSGREEAFSVTFNHQDTEMFCEYCLQDIVREYVMYDNCPVGDDCRTVSIDNLDCAEIITIDNNGRISAPQHCAECGDLLDILLDREGIDYVADAIKTWNNSQSRVGDRGSMKEWADLLSDSIRDW